jgi:hypothetical protein
MNKQPSHSLREVLSNLFSGWGIGGGTPPTINQAGYSALSPEIVNEGRARMADTIMAAANTPVARRMSEGQITPLAQEQVAMSAPAPRVTPKRRVVPVYDVQAMQELVDSINTPITEGQNKNIDDVTRARALAWALRNNGE